MATKDGEEILDVVSSFYDANGYTTGQQRNGDNHVLGHLIYYLMAAPAAVTGGYITWINTTGDDTNKVGTSTGTTFIMATWPW